MTSKPTTWSLDWRRRGTAAEFAAMAEFIFRGFNVAMPVIDDGDDTLVLDQNTQLWRVQVKSSQGKKRAYGLACEWLVPVKQLALPEGRVALWYCLVARHPAGYWSDFLLIARDELRSLVELAGIAKKTGRNKDQWKLHIKLHEERTLISSSVLNDQIDLQCYRANWSFERHWPKFEEKLI